MSVKIKYTLSLFCSLLPLFIFGQPSFLCLNNSFLVADNHNLPTELFRLGVDTDLGIIDFTTLGSANGFVNAIGFSSADGLIYGIDMTTNELYRFYGDGTAEFLTEIVFPDNTFYPAGDVSADGKYLYLLSLGSTTNMLSAVDLESGDYNVVNQEMVPSSGEAVFCTDMAFHPYTQQLFGYDSRTDRLIVIDIENQVIDNLSYPAQGVFHNFPALFFDAFGRLFGVGDDLVGEGKSLYAVDVTSGAVSVVAPVAAVDGNMDGCSCPSTVALEQTLTPDALFACLETELVIRIANGSGMPQAGVHLLEILEDEMTVEAISYNPYQGDVGSTVGSHVIDIDNLIIPPGLDSIVLQINVGQLSPDTYQFQALLDGITLPDGLDTFVVSDNPATLQRGDSSVLTIIPLTVDLSNNQNYFCDTTELIVDNHSTFELNYQWNTGGTDSILTVTTPGRYAVTVSVGCEVTTDSIDVQSTMLSLELEEEVLVLLGEEITLYPDLQSNSEEVVINWFKQDTLACFDCWPYRELAIESASYTACAEDEFGCVAKDSVQVIVVKDYQVYSPNAFSPNNDGTNDIFYLQAKHSQSVELFQVFNRWGGLVFSQKNIETNNAFVGWNGQYLGDAAAAGSYVWHARIRFLDGAIREYGGEVVLVR